MEEKAGNGMPDLSRSILILEADEGLADVMVELLGREGGQVTVTRTVRDAIAHLSAHSAGAVILDLDTVSQGAEHGSLTALSHWLRAHIPSPALIFVSVSVPSAEAIGVLSSMLLSADQSVKWVPKPFCNEDFLAVVRRTLGRRPSQTS